MKDKLEQRQSGRFLCIKLAARTLTVLDLSLSEDSELDNFLFRLWFKSWFSGASFSLESEISPLINRASTLPEEMNGLNSELPPMLVVDDGEAQAVEDLLTI